MREVLEKIRIKIQNSNTKAQIQPFFIATVNHEFVMEAQREKMKEIWDNEYDKVWDHV